MTGSWGGTVLRLLADNNAVGYVEAIVREMQSPKWADFWTLLGLALAHFPDVGLDRASSDRTIWQICQAENLLLVTDNRNQEGPDSLEATIRELNGPDNLPIFTISDLDAFRASRAYVEQVVESLYDYLIRIDDLRGTGRLYLP